MWLELSHMGTEISTKYVLVIYWMRSIHWHFKFWIWIDGREFTLFSVISYTIYMSILTFTYTYKYARTLDPEKRIAANLVIGDNLLPRKSYSTSSSGLARVPYIITTNVPPQHIQLIFFIRLIVWRETTLLRYSYSSLKKSLLLRLAFKPTCVTSFIRFKHKCPASDLLKHSIPSRFTETYLCSVSESRVFMAITMQMEHWQVQAVTLCIATCRCV